MALTPFIPLDPDESALSWATRLAATHCGEPLVPFLNDIGVKLDALLMGTDEALSTLAQVTEESFGRLSENAVRTVEWRNYVLRGEPFTTEFLRGERTGFCALCLAEDDARGPAARERRGRLLWLIRSVRTCPRHRIPLVDRPFTGWLDRTHQMALRVPERGDDLIRLSSGPVRRVSALQTYISARLEGASGPAWLDGQTIAQAARAAEMIGVAVAFDRDVNLREMPETAWETAAEVGFEIASGGPDRIRDALSEIQRRAWSEEKVSGHSGPQKLFGRLYQWLNFSKSSKDVGPIREVVREHILDTMVVEPGTILFGEPVSRRRRHNLATLARESGLHWKTLRNAFRGHGAGGDAVGATFSLAEADEVVTLLKDAVPQSQLPKVLNTSRAQVEQLLDSRLLRVIDPGKADGTRMGTSVTMTEIRRFLSELAAGAPETAEAPAGFLPIPEAAKVSRVTAANIVRAVLAGMLSGVARLSGVAGYSAIVVDPAEVASVYPPPPETPSVSLTDACAELGLSYATGKAVTRTTPGAVRLATFRSERRGGLRVLPDEVDRFRATYATLFVLAKEVDRHHLALAEALSAAGVTPAGSTSEYAATIYRRSDLPLALGGAG